jgi:Reverse transcriptase (RNA-dependent DNA polymerase)
MDQINPAPLDWALSHILRYGDTDIFPVPFEFEAISHAWLSIRPALERLDLCEYVPSAGQRVLVPKPGGGFRVAVQLDPIDSILYTAMAYEAAESIEQSRVDRAQQVACSYRINLDAKGSFFAVESGWADFHRRSVELTNIKGFTHVLLADISDFYNQVSLHRVESALYTANLARPRVNTIHEFLLALNLKQSRGLPVGPLPSILLAEALLTDVDNFLLRRGASYVRYVDDFRIFCRSRVNAITLQHDLTEYLYTSHRLSLESHKTRIMHVSKFVQEELRDPEEEEREAKADKLNDLIQQLKETTGYDVSADDLPEDEHAVAVRESLSALFNTCVAMRPLHLGLARHLLRRAVQMKTAVIVDQVLDHLEVLAPVFRDASRYLVRCVPRNSALIRGGRLMEFLNKSDVGRLPFIRMWGLEMFRQRKEMGSESQIWALAEESVPALGQRYLALIACAFGQLDWVRARKENWRNHGAWDRRGIIWSSCILPHTERKPWLDIVAGAGDHCDCAVAQFSRSKP